MRTLLILCLLIPSLTYADPVQQSKVKPDPSKGSGGKHGTFEDNSIDVKGKDLAELVAKIGPQAVKQWRHSAPVKVKRSTMPAARRNAALEAALHDYFRMRSSYAWYSRVFRFTLAAKLNQPRQLAVKERHQHNSSRNHLHCPVSRWLGPRKTNLRVHFFGPQLRAFAPTFWRPRTTDFPAESDCKVVVLHGCVEWSPKQWDA